MSYKARNVIGWAVLVVGASAYGRISRDWDFGTYYAGAMGVTAVLVSAILLWTQVGPGEKPHHRHRQ